MAGIRGRAARPLPFVWAWCGRQARSRKCQWRLKRRNSGFSTSRPPSSLLLLVMMAACQVPGGTLTAGQAGEHFSLFGGVEIVDLTALVSRTEVRCAQPYQSARGRSSTLDKVTTPAVPKCPPSEAIVAAAAQDREQRANRRAHLLR